MRKILHIDMDAFYASVEQRDNPSLKGRPVIVGGDAEKRGVVSAASYEARAFGVHSAMPASQARRLCPQGVFLPVRMDRYRQVSGQIFAIFQEYTPLIEPLSLDESFLDVTGCETLFGPAPEIAAAIKRKILARTGLTASAGIAPNKFLAKIASDWRKPDGLVEIKPEEVGAFLENLPVSKLWGVGKSTEEVLKGMGILRAGPAGPVSPGRDRKESWGNSAWSCSPWPGGKTTARLSPTRRPSPSARSRPSRRIFRIGKSWNRSFWIRRNRSAGNCASRN